MGWEDQDRCGPGDRSRCGKETWYQNVKGPPRSSCHLMLYCLGSRSAGGAVTSLRCEMDIVCPPEGTQQQVPGDERPGHRGETFCLPVAVIWAHRHLDLRPNPGDHYLFNWEKTQGSFACLCGSYSLLEGRGFGKCYVPSPALKSGAEECSSLALRVSDLFDKL